MTVIEAIAKRIHEIQGEKNLTNYAVCKKATVDLTTIHNIFNNRQKVISFNILLLLCDGLGVSIQEFLSSPLFNRGNFDID
jgi:DNA-binding Xre family transcriptional regulator